MNIVAPAISATPTEEQDQLRRAVRGFLKRFSPEAEVRRLMDDQDGYARDVWSQMAQMLGLQGLSIDERYGGAGASAAESAVVFEEMGRVLLCAPYLATVALAANVFLEAGDDAAAATHLPALASGEKIATLAVAEDDADWDGSNVRLGAREVDGTYLLTGTKLFVPDGHVADTIVVVARTARGLSFFAVDGTSPGLTRTRMRAMDQTRSLARLEFNRVRGQLVGSDGHAAPVLDRVLDLAAVALAAEQVGGACRCLEMAVDYAKHRVQFDRPIGSFQAIKHRLADLLLEVECATSAVHYASRHAAARSDQFPAAASIAKAYCSEAYCHVAAETIQVHGGLGFTWEHPAHLYFKRARSSAQLLGSPTMHRERLAKRLGL
jgi:alkylation response protein AidB-like acyl-CoA dehydrogenase